MRGSSTFPADATAAYFQRAILLPVASIQSAQRPTSKPRSTILMGQIAPKGDMAAVYRQKTFAGPLQKIANHVRPWYLGEKVIE
jgi:hypothetical protein